MLIALPIAGIVGYVAFARWPAGAAAGNAQGMVLTTQPIETKSIRIATYNVHSLIGDDGRRDPDRTAAMLRDFDVVGLQEVRGYFSGAPRTQAEALGRSLSMNALFAPTERTRFHDDFGNAALTRLNVDSWFRIPLPGTQAAGHRNVVMLRTHLAGKPLTVLITHIDRVEDRALQLQAVWQLFSSLDEPCVVMGDFNTKRSDPLLHAFLTGATDAVAANLTATAPDRDDRIDWIFTRGVRVTASGIVDSHASDHPLVWAELTLP
jgi:endonuclease/exonuclease/phosphatase family metal-dependent hydrolase